MINGHLNAPIQSAKEKDISDECPVEGTDSVANDRPVRITRNKLPFKFNVYDMY